MNTIIVSLATAFFTVMLGALAAFAFSRFRFRGRRTGMLFVLLIQMFPQLLLVVAIYLIVFNLGGVFPVLGLNSITAIIVVYLGGVLSVNTWLMKGFFDTIPKELDESARVDGATPSQLYWGVVLPLATPVLAVIALLSFIGTLNEYVIASVLLQSSKHQTLPVGLYNFINAQYQQYWGPFAAGVLLAAVPVIILFMSLQKFIIGGLTRAPSRDDGDRARLAAALAEPYHDGSDACVPERPASSATGRRGLRVPRASSADTVALRYVHDGEPRIVQAVVEGESNGETIWRATFRPANPATRYRWLLAGGEIGWAWVNGTGVVTHDVPDDDDFVLVPADRDGPAWHLESVVYEIFPDRFASSGLAVDAPDWAVRREWDELPIQQIGMKSQYELFGGDLRGVEQHLDHIASLGANALYLTPFFPAGSVHRYDSTSFEHVDPLLGGDEALSSLLEAAHARGIRVVGDLTTNHVGIGHDWFTETSRLLLRRRGGLRLVDGGAHAAEAELGKRRAPRGDGEGRPEVARLRPRRLAHRRREHDGPSRRRRRGARGRARRARGGGRRRHRRGARSRLSRRPRRGRLARRDELRRLPASGLVVAARRRLAATPSAGTSRRRSSEASRRSRRCARSAQAFRGSRLSTPGRCSTVTTRRASAR